MTRPIAIVQHEPSVPPGLISDVFDAMGRPFDVIDAWRDPEWPAIDDISALVVMGGTMNVDELDKYPFLKASRDLMAEAIEHRVPTLGVCLGSQMMARVLGAEVVRADRRNALFSRIELSTEGKADAVVEPFSETDVLQFHEDTFRVPDEATPLAMSASSGLAQAFRYGENAYAIQFHFEVDGEIVRGWLENIGRRAMLEDWGVESDELLRTAERLVPDQRRAGTKLVEGWLELVPSD